MKMEKGEAVELIKAKDYSDMGDFCLVGG